jgi:uncharacterized protein with PQ loop repeat
MIVTSGQILYLGLSATAVNAISQIPQVLITYSTDNVEAISLSTNVLLFIAQCLWFIYAYYVNSIPLLISAGMTGILCLIIIVRVSQLRRKNPESVASNQVDSYELV